METVYGKGPLTYAEDKPENCCVNQPPPATMHVAEGAVDEAGGELSPGDEERVDGHQLTPEVRWRRLGNVHRHRHGGHPWTAENRRRRAVLADTETATTQSV